MCGTSVFIADRCYKLFTDLKTWTAARKHCHDQYADLVTWRNNADEVLLRSIGEQWLPTSSALLAIVTQSNRSHLAWSGGTITSSNRKLNNFV
jgi:hypothetical protein